MSKIIESERDAQIARVRGQILPIISTIMGSMVTIIPMIAISPSLPPFGLMILLSWRLLRPELWPVWIGLPLGLADDLFSGQPIGNSMMLWTISLLAVDYIDRRLVWRDYWQDWLIAAAAITFCLAGGLFAANMTGGDGNIVLIIQQICVSILCFPIVVRLCALLDRWRLS